MELSSYDSIAILSFAQQPEYPRLTRAVLAELRDQLNAVQAADCFEGLVIAANEHSFAVGAAVEEVTDLSGVAAFQFARLGQAIFRAVADAGLPVVAAIRGFCLGGGLDLALACHCRVAAYNSSFGYPAGSLGLVTGWGGTGQLSQWVGRAVALQVFVSGERVPATQALTMGLADELVPAADLLPAAVRWAQRLRAAPIIASRN